MYGYTENKQEYKGRLSRIEGQVRGLQRMVDEDIYCIDILQQIAAIDGALQKVAIGLLNDHLGHCVTGAVTRDDPAEVEELVAEATAAISRLIRAN
ncbi:metal-sensitive transcriptional regulator [Euzebya tangerina]|uniref:metal-sensitive transcriptional regulator n=1 Tax=Euzebya tangerina TaxID=591198 RepID=UPI000E30F67F|nr:metal-sensitive transcriptional regulator [Euzebya tangerina]